MLILVAVSILIVLTLGGLWLHTTRQLLEDNIYSSDRSDSRQLAEYIRTYLDDITNNLDIISTNPDTANAIRSNDSIRLQQIIENLNMSSPHIDTVAIIDNSGRILRGTRAPEVPNINVYPWYAEMAQYKTAYITGIYHSYSAHEYAFAILTPIQDNNMIYGRIMAIITPDTLHDNIKAHYYNSQDNILVVDSNGRVISSENLTKMAENTNVSAYSPVQQVLSGASGVIEHSDTWDGQQRISAFQPVPGSNWGVIVSTPLNVEYKQLNDLIRWILGILLASIVAVSLLGYLLSRLITGPIVRLSETMKQIARGNYHLRAKTRRRDEIGDLAGTFNTMMDSLEDARSQSEMYLDLMGHDINNMNQVALGYLQLAEEKIKSGEHLQEDSNVLITKPIDALEDSSRLIDNIRKLQRARAGEMPRVTVDISAVMKN
jgi:Signal transduction histidine kinase